MLVNKSIKPGDIITASNGNSIEIINLTLNTFNLQCNVEWQYTHNSKDVTHFYPLDEFKIYCAKEGFI